MAADSNSNLVAIGASAGGIEAVGRVLSELPPALDAAILVVVHVAPVANRLASVLARRSALPVAQAIDGEALETGRVYLAAPDHHLLVDDAHIRVVRGPHENGHRPAIDPLFRSAAAARRGGLVAVVLTGSLDDGAAGSATVSRLGGHVVVQDPDDAAHPSMPLNAIAVDHPDEVLPLAGIAAAIVRFIGEHQETEPPSEQAAREDDQLDRALAEALRALEERADLAGRVARRLRSRGLDRRASGHDQVAEESARHALVIRNVLLHRNVDGGSAEN